MMDKQSTPLTRQDLINKILSIKREFNHKIDNLLEIVTNEFDELKGGVESPKKLTRSDKKQIVEQKIREQFAKYQYKKPSNFRS
ncbi:hypothetical protein CMU73_13460 [Elizabethkingia anophelis]|nr:hypothetical protein A6J37_04525 [Elizabethkingia anophelis]MDV3460772.1 hypothetical protein [Elizabethkingia anophelis]MDV3571643.1 hypothetical protein [Elizabethkingia anophelis]MDV3667982.1 hypothetical protein [Elizabethkingia anophelis]MDV3936317.1 hypothetical protein [Elizabethkingia anophelis]